MRWQLIIGDFGPTIQHIAGFDNMLSDTLSRLPSTPSGKYEPCTRKAQFFANKLFAIGGVEKKKYILFPLNILIVQVEQQKELRNINSKLSTYISDQGSGYSMQALDYVDIICYDRKIYLPKFLRRRVIY